MACRIWIVCLSLAGAGIVLPAFAQEGLLEELYGRGVHAYFEHRYEDSHGALTKAITSGLDDPRAHYFRGLTYLRLGRPDEAQADFKKGAELEASSSEPVNVGRSLERIQGADRMLIERQRRASRLALQDKAAAAAKARYEEFMEAEKRVLLPPRKSSNGTKPASAAADASNPFSEDGSKPAPLPAPVEGAKPAGSPEPAPANPGTPAPPTDGDAPAAAAEPRRGSVFGSLFRAVKNGIPDAGNADGAPKAVPAGDAGAPDPFGNPPAKPAPPKSVEPMPAPAKNATDDPFADPK